MRTGYQKTYLTRLGYHDADALLGRVGRIEPTIGGGFQRIDEARVISVLPSRHPDVDVDVYIQVKQTVIEKTE